MRTKSGEAFTFSNANDLAAFNLYGYNTRSEVTSAARYWGTDTGDTADAVDGQQYAYAFDPTRLRPSRATARHVGNRITAAEGDTSRTASYTANELNQYSQRTVPGVKELAGTALADATVTVNELPTDRFASLVAARFCGGQRGVRGLHSSRGDRRIQSARDQRSRCCDLRDRPRLRSRNSGSVHVRR